MTATEVTKHVDFDPNDIQRVAVRKHERLQVVEYDPTWPESFRVISKRIKDALGDRVLDVIHVGSTSIPGLPAKNVIDVDVIVTDPSKEEQYVPDMENAGFQLLHREPGWFQHRFFACDEPYSNVHCFGPNCPMVIQHQIFREWMMDPNHRDDFEKYVQIKQEASRATLAAGETGNQYNLRKQPFIRAVLDRAFKTRGLLD
ncbi:hypothetical protein Plec18167_007872 [Paecilomyces lecythidis]|uniref:GrpB domain protein n=1 Tax=Paecilomyces lecythidis TaxID=3004212 RepID=A0ABR3X131_9EURO